MGRAFSGDNLQYIDTCDSLTGWTTGGTAGTVTVATYDGSPSASSIRANGGGYCYIIPTNITSLSNKTITLNMKVNSSGTANLCNFIFAANSTGAGQFVRLDARTAQPSGFATTNSWSIWASPTSGTTVSPETWYSVKIQINEQNTASWYLNGTLQASGYVCKSNGTYIACHGDGPGGAGISGGRFDQIVIYQGII